MQEKSSDSALSNIQTVPWIETLRGLFKFVENPIPVINNAMERLGTTYYTRLIGGRKIIMSSDPVVAKHVLQKNHKNYEKSELQTESLGQYVGQGLLTSNGAFWLRQRRLIQPGFHRERLTGLIHIMDEEVRSYIEQLKKRVGKNAAELDMSGEMMQLTLRVVSRALFSTGISQEQVAFLNETFTNLQRHIIKEVRQPIFNWWRRISGKSSAWARTTRPLPFRTHPVALLLR